MSGDLIEPPGSHQPYNRAGKLKRWRVALANILVTPMAGGVFIAIIRDSESGVRLREIELYRGQPGEIVDLLVECEKNPK